MSDTPENTATPGDDARPAAAEDPAGAQPAQPRYAPPPAQVDPAQAARYAPQPVQPPQQPQQQAPAQQAPAQPADAQQPQQPSGQQPQYPQGQPQQAPQYAQAPGAYQAAQPGGAPQQPGGQPYPPKKKGLSTGAILGIAGGGVLLLLLIIGAIVTAVIMSSSGGGGAKPDAKGSPADAVEQYLQALADADADAALVFLSGSDGELFSQEALEASQDLAPITDIVVDAESESSDEYGDTTVSASFTIGDRAVTRDFTLYDAYDGWVLLDGTAQLSVSSFAGLDPTINGIEISEDYAEGFIGAYEIELGNEHFTLGEADEPLVLATRDDSTNMYSLRPELTPEATQQFRDTIRTSLAECIAMNTLATPCTEDLSGQFSDGAIPIEGTAVRTLTPEGDAALAALTPETSSDRPQIVRAHDHIAISTVIDAEKDGMRGTGEVIIGGSVRTPAVDFGKDDLTVTWE